MKTVENIRDGQDEQDGQDEVAALKQNRMMAHLLEALERGADIGHYGRLTFAIVARHFLPRETLIAWLSRDSDFDEDRATLLVEQVESRGYSPPRRERIMAWQAEQDFPITPDADDPDEANVYRDLKFPDHVYAHIEQYRVEKLHARHEHEQQDPHEQHEQASTTPRHDRAREPEYPLPLPKRVREAGRHA